MQAPGRFFLTLALTLFLCGCGVVRSTQAVQQAMDTYTRAQRVGAAERAKYEFTLGAEYLQKAREQAGYSDYASAESLALQASGHLRKAIQLAGDEVEEDASKRSTDESDPALEE